MEMEASIPDIERIRLYVPGGQEAYQEAVRIVGELPSQRVGRVLQPENFLNLILECLRKQRARDL